MGEQKEKITFEWLLLNNPLQYVFQKFHNSYVIHLI
jgi:hypothetical protein